MQPNQYSVEVFNDNLARNESPWIRLGIFNRLDQAISACRKVIDDYLNQHRHLTLTADQLATNYLMYGPAPCINGTENLKSFDLYEYLNRRCAEVS
jgi:hypothetical protein